MSYIIFVNPISSGSQGPRPEEARSAVRGRPHLHVSDRRRHDLAHGPGQQPRLRPRAGLGINAVSLSSSSPPRADDEERHGIILMEGIVITILVLTLP